MQSTEKYKVVKKSFDRYSVYEKIDYIGFLSGQVVKTEWKFLDSFRSLMEAEEYMKVLSEPPIYYNAQGKRLG